MANKLPDWKERILWRSFQEGTTAAEAARRAQASTITVEARFWRWREGQIPEREAYKSVYSALDVHVKSMWRQEAKKRGVPLRFLIWQVANKVAVKGHFDAILGKHNGH